MQWQQLDQPTRTGFVAAVVGVVAVIIPPFSLASAVVAVIFSAVGWRRSHQRGEANPVARYSLLGSVALIVVVVVGSAIYAAASP